MRIQVEKTEFTVSATAEGSYEHGEIAFRLTPSGDDEPNASDVILLLDEAEMHKICLMLSAARLDMWRQRDEARVAKMQAASATAQPTIQASR